MKVLPYEITEQMIQCFGKCFHFKDPVAAFMISSGVPSELVNKYRNEYKFVWARRVIEELSGIQNGDLIKSKMLTNLCKLRDLPDSEVKDRDAGIEALCKLKKLAMGNQLYTEKQSAESNERLNLVKQKELLIRQRLNKLESLRQTFNEQLISTNRQSAGFTLEDILKDLFGLSDIEYRKSYRNPTNTQQIDGHFRFEGFDYLVEAKWTKGLPNTGEISTFKFKVESKLESTRGLFVSVNGFREEVINSFSGNGSKIIFMSGQDLIHILEGRIDLQEALKIKIEKGAQEGITYFPIFNY